MKSRKYIIVILMLISVIMSCSKDGDDNNDSGENINLSSVITKIYAIDAGNNLGSEDIYVRIEKNQTELDKIRIMIVPASASGGLTIEDAQGLSTGNYQDVFNLTNLTFQLQPNIKDVSGADLQLNQQYVIRIAAFKSTSSNLSSTTKLLTLTNDNPLKGRYVGTWNDNIYTDFGISANITSAGATSMSGAFYYSDSFAPCCQNPSNDGTISFSGLNFENNAIESFTYDQVLADFMGGQCNGTYSGSNGTINGLTLTIGFTGEDCEGPHTNGELKMTRLVE